MGNLGRVAPLVFSSGACALIYQAVWFRELRLVFGSSAFASAAVLAIFMAGLGIGGAWLGRRADRHPSPLTFYANLELIVAGSAALTPLLVWLVREAYIGMGGLSALGTFGAGVVRMLLAAVILAVPTVAMGGTFPAAARAVQQLGDERRRATAALYGVNTLGAVAGTVLATFALLEIYGGRQTLWLAALLNAAVAVMARGVARGLPQPGPGGLASAPSPASPPPGPRPALPPQRFVLAAAAVVGFAFFSMELIWYRMLAPLLGGSTFSFGCILAVALAGIGAGGFAYSTLGSFRVPTLKGFAFTCALEALFLAIPFALGDDLAIAAGVLQGMGVFGFGGLTLAWVLVCSLLVFIPAFIAGVQFPLLIGLLGRGGEHLGKDVGLAYAFNTGGSIAGSLLAGFVLVPALGALVSWKLMVMLLFALAVAAAVLHARTGERRQVVPPVGLAALGVALLFVSTGPTAGWRHSGIGAGRAGFDRQPSSAQAFLNNHRRQLVWERDGRESSVALMASESYSFYVNGKSDGSSIGDAATQVMGGLLGALLHPEPRRALVVGLGTGSTSGWLGAVPSIEAVDTVEIEPAIAEVARACGPVNKDVLDNPKVRVLYEDAREVLLTSDQRYDIIFSEPSNPYRAGIASLFTEEFYQAVAGRLADDGIFIQWVQGYEVDVQTIQTVAATLKTQFTSVELWFAVRSDAILVARKQPAPYSARRLAERAAAEPYREALAVAWGVAGAEGVLSHFAGSAQFVDRLIAEDTPVNTDDRNHVEYSFARSLGTRRTFSLGEAWLRARAAGQDRPPLVDGAVDWDAVDAARLVWLQVTPPPGVSAAASARAQVVNHAAAGRYEAALRSRREVPGALTHPSERLAEAVSASRALAPELALPLLDAYAREEPVAARALRARVLLRKNEPRQAAEELMAVLEAHYRTPWIKRGITSTMFELMGPATRGDRAARERFFHALAEPFPVANANGSRLKARIDLAMSTDARRLCVEAFAPFAEHPIWSRPHLEARMRCYRGTSDPLLGRAIADLMRFRSQTPYTVDDVIEEAPRPAGPPTSPPAAPPAEEPAGDPAPAEPPEPDSAGR